MKPLITTLLAIGILAGVIACGTNGNAQDVPDAVLGNWEGKLKVQAMELRLVFRFAKTAEKVTAEMDSPDQGTTGIPVSNVSVNGDQLAIEVSTINGTYSGTLSPDGNTVDGKWKQSGMEFPLEMKRVSELTKLNRPQEPQPPFPYQTEDVTFKNDPAKIELAGTLCIPTGDGPFPAAVLISGSGPQDRDEFLLGHKPFWVIADDLVRRGIAVLRYDDRGVGKSTGDFGAATSQDFATDAFAAVKFLQSRGEIDRGKIGLIGHSEGGLIAPIVAVDHPDAIAFIVMLAGPGLPGDQILEMQYQLIGKQSGLSEELLTFTKENSHKTYEIIKTEPDNQRAAQKLRDLFDENWGKMSDSLKAEAQKSGDPKQQLEQNIQILTNPWFRFFLSYDPRPTLAKLQCPVLAINGELDLQVPPKENLAAIETALKSGKNSDVTVKEFPKLNHLFQTSTTGGPDEYGNIEETFAPVALDFMGGWIVERFVK